MKVALFKSTMLKYRLFSYSNFGPSVRLLLEQYGLSPDQIPPGGPHGIILKGDVLRIIREKNLQPQVLPTG